MVEAMKKVSQTNSVELSVEERNLLSVAYKNVIGARRASWRILASIESKEKSRNNEAHEGAIKEYRKKVCSFPFTLLFTSAAFSVRFRLFHLISITGELTEFRAFCLHLNVVGRWPGGVAR